MSQQDARVLFSIGHSNVAVEQLIALLDQHGIAVVCDVRSTPYSRYAPQFNREALLDALPQVGISYHWLGDALGGMPQDPSLRTDDNAHADYDKIAQTAMFQQGLERLVAFGRRAPTAFMCGEADYRGCHRHRLITPALIGRGLAVWHIMANGHLERGEREPQQMRMF